MLAEAIHFRTYRYADGLRFCFILFFLLLMPFSTGYAYDIQVGWDSEAGQVWYRAYAASARRGLLAAAGPAPTGRLWPSGAGRYPGLAGLLAGIVLFLAATLQQVGLQYTTAGKAGFITGLYVVWVPIIGMAFRQRTNTGTCRGRSGQRRPLPAQ